MTQKITPTLLLYDATLDRINAEAARRGVDPAELMSELLTVGAAALSGGGAADVERTDSAQRDFYTVTEAAERLRLQPRTVADYCRKGKIAAVKVGRGWRIGRDALAAYTAER